MVHSLYCKFTIHLPYICICIPSKMDADIEAREEVAVLVGAFGEVSWMGNRLSTSVTRTFLF
jgi:hypothetical protein